MLVLKHCTCVLNNRLTACYNTALRLPAQGSSLVILVLEDSLQLPAGILPQYTLSTHSTLAWVSLQL